MVVEVEVIKPRFHVFPRFAAGADALGEKFQGFHVTVGASLVVVGAPMLDFPRRALQRRVFFDPREDFTVAFAGGNFRLQRLVRDAGEPKPMPIHRVIVFVFARRAGECGATLVEDASEEDVAAEPHARAARRTLGEVGCWVHKGCCDLFWSFAYGDGLSSHRGQRDDQG